MNAFDSFPLGQPGFVSHILDRAAHLRGDETKLLAMESRPDARAYVVYRDSLVVRREATGPRALLSIEEALKFGANPGTIFLGLREGAPVFGMGISPPAVEKLSTRDDAAVETMTTEIQAAVKDRKGSVQSPKRVVVVDALPLTGLGKPDKKAVRAQFWEGAGRAVG